MVRKQKIEEPTFPTQDVVASAFAAHRINKGYFRETRRFSTEGMDTLFSNKEMLTYQFSEKQYRQPDFKKFRILKKDKDLAKEAIDWLHKENALNIIAGNLTDFMDSLMKCIS